MHMNISPDKSAADVSAADVPAAARTIFTREPETGTYFLDPLMVDLSLRPWYGIPPVCQVAHFVSKVELINGVDYEGRIFPSKRSTSPFLILLISLRLVRARRKWGRS